AVADARLARIKSLGPSAPAAAGSIELVPIPLTTSVWSDAIFHRPLTNASVLLAILADRDASFVCHGLAALNDETLAFFADHPAVLTRIYERSAASFAAFGGSLRIDGGRVAPPGGPDSVPLWETV